MAAPTMSNRMRAAMETLKAVVRDDPKTLTGLAETVRGQALDTLESVGRYITEKQDEVRRGAENRLRLADALDVLAVEAGK